MLLAAPNQWIDLKSGAAYDPDPSVLVSKTIATDSGPEVHAQTSRHLFMISLRVTKT